MQQRSDPNDPDPATLDAFVYVVLNESVALEVSGAFEAAERSAREGLTLARKLQSLPLEARLLEQLATALTWNDRQQPAASVAEEALGVSELVGDAALVANCSGTLAFTLWRASRSDEAMTEAQRRPTESMNRLGHLVEGMILAERGNVEGARTALTAAVAAAAKEQNAVAEGDALVALASTAADEERDYLVSRAITAYRRAGHWRSKALPAHIDLRTTVPGIRSAPP
jgi:hypothetical protein